MGRLFTCAIAALIAVTTSTMAATPAVCVLNGGTERLFFAAEAKNGARTTGWLDPADTLCSAATGAVGGVVSVFPGEDEIEGCSRLVPDNAVETLHRYADFDRCLWASNAN